MATTLRWNIKGHMTQGDEADRADVRDRLSRTNPASRPQSADDHRDDQLDDQPSGEQHCVRELTDQDGETDDTTCPVSVGEQARAEEDDEWSAEDDS